MSDIRDVLDQVSVLIRAVKLDDAQQRLTGLLRTMGPPELRVWDQDLRAVIERFLPKRRKALTELLNRLLQDEILTQQNSPAGRLDDQPSNRDLGELVLQLDRTLNLLSAHHIFQWSTFYRDELGEFFSSAVRLAGHNNQVEWRAVQALLAKHASTIFVKGYMHVTRTATDQHAIFKSLSGLRRFLDLFIEFYSGAIGPAMLKDEAIVLRELQSSCLLGILEGYSTASFGKINGREVLLDRPDSWVHVTGFMTGSGINDLAHHLRMEDPMTGACGVIRPLASALDRMLDVAGKYLPLPVLSQYSEIYRRIDVSLQPSRYAPERRLLEIQCYTDSATVTDHSLMDSLSRGVGAIVAPLRPDVRQTVSRDPAYGAVIAIMEDTGGKDSTRDRIVTVLEDLIYRVKNPTSLSQTLNYNFAREFPLTNPVMSPYYFVVRNSVRDLLRTFERRNGVRLWCSVRRSGKTKAGSDLASTTEESTLLSQTCDSTGDATGDSLIYARICAAIEDGRQISPDFFQKCLLDCADGTQIFDKRIVLVLDEYETLFGQLRTAVQFDERIRYTVAQPVLNQMVQFARDNLLVFLGQQPNAHLILMDQNQLSPYVEQDSFPLFQNAGQSQEFHELISKVFSGRATFDSTFVDRIYIETSGHPFLTVNLLIEFVEWLIRTKRPLNSLDFTAADVSTFAARSLRRDRVSISPEYQFYRDGAIPQALGRLGRERSPWLYAMYLLIQKISRNDPESFVCTRSDFVGLVTDLGLEDLGYSADGLLATGSQANFLTYTDRIVSPRIRLLGRIAAISTAESVI